MTIRPVLSALLRNRTGAILVIGQIALTLAIVVNAVFISKQRIELMNRDTGIDKDNIVTVASMGFGENYDHESTVREDLAMLRTLPNVIEAVAMSSIPLSGSGSASGFRASADDDSLKSSANYYNTTATAPQALGFELYAGRFFREDEVRFNKPNENAGLPAQVVITKPLAESLFETPDAVGKLFYNSLGEAAEVIGVIENMMGAWVRWDKVDHVALFPEVSSSPTIRYAVRVTPGMADEMLPRIEEAMQRPEVKRIVNRTTSIGELAKRQYEGDKAVAVVLVVVVILLFIMAGLGILGLASFSVGQRTKQIGTRRAVGARKRDIIYYFMIENWLLTSIGLVAGAIMTVVLNAWMSSEFGLERLDMWYVVAGVVAIWLLGQLAVAGPAQRAARISPAVATRTV